MTKRKCHDCLVFIHSDKSTGDCLLTGIFSSPRRLACKYWRSVTNKYKDCEPLKDKSKVCLDCMFVLATNSNEGICALGCDKIDAATVGCKHWRIYTDKYEDCEPV